MKLLDLIPYLRTEKGITELEKRVGISHSEWVSIFMENSLDINAEVKLIRSDESGGKNLYVKDDISWHCLLDVYTALEVIEGFTTPDQSDLEIAERVFHYGIYDA